MSGKFLKTWGILLVAIFALGASLYALNLDYAHFKESMKLQEQRYEELNKQYEESLELARTALELTNKHYQELSKQYEESLELANTALELTNKHYQELSKQYEELTKPHTQHEEVYDKLVRLDMKIIRANELLYMPQAADDDIEYIEDLKYSLSIVESLRDKAEEAWLKNDYNEADKIFEEAYGILNDIAGPGGGGIPSVTNIDDIMTPQGRLTEKVTAESNDGKVELFLAKNTIVLDEKGQPVRRIIMRAMEEPPEPPSASKIIGFAYDFTPDGITFDPPAQLTFTYDPALIPDVVSKYSLVIALFDAEAGEWVNLVSTVDPATSTITAQIKNFTAFTVLGFIWPVPPYIQPAEFTISGLTITPTVVDTGESVNISVLITNIGELAGTYQIALKSDNVAVATKDVSLDGGASHIVTFTTSRDVAGTYTIDIGGLSGTFTVRATPPPTPHLNWWLIGYLIAAAMIIGTIATWIYTRRRVLRIE